MKLIWIVTLFVSCTAFGGDYLTQLENSYRKEQIKLADKYYAVLEKRKIQAMKQGSLALANKYQKRQDELKSEFKKEEKKKVVKKTEPSPLHGKWIDSVYRYGFMITSDKDIRAFTIPTGKRDGKILLGPRVGTYTVTGETIFAIYNGSEKIEYTFRLDNLGRPEFISSNHRRGVYLMFKKLD